MDTPFSRQLRIWMAAENVTANDLAAAVGVEPMTVYRWRSGQNAPIPEYWDAIAQTLGVERGEIAKLLIGVRILGPRAQDIADRLDALPAATQREAVALIAEMLDRLDEKDSKHNVVFHQAVGA